MHACAYAVYGIEKITFHRASNVRAGCVAAKAVETQSGILAQLKILQKMNLLEDLEKVKKSRFFEIFEIFRDFENQRKINENQDFTF